MNIKKININIAFIEPFVGHDIYDFNLICAIEMSENFRAVLYTSDERVIDGMQDVKLTYKSINGSDLFLAPFFVYLKWWERNILNEFTTKQLNAECEAGMSYNNNTIQIDTHQTCVFATDLSRESAQYRSMLAWSVCQDLP